MTRQEALTKLKNNKGSFLELEFFINKIYDDFELLNTSERLTCEGCKWYELINDSVTCRWCERYPRMPFKDYWESKE